MRFILALILLFALPIVPTSAAAQGRTLICFERSGLDTSLNRITNERQLFAANDTSITAGGSCDWAVAPKGSFSAYFDGWYESRTFIFPVFELDYDRDGLKRFSVEGVFRKDAWQLSTDCGRGRFANQCLVPRNCDVLRDYLNLSGNLLPDFMRAPRDCLVYRG